MAKNTGFETDAAFNESLQKRISGYERKAERAKKAWHNAQAGSKIAGSVDFVDVPEFHLERKFDKDTGKVSYEIGQGSKKIRTPHLEGIKRLKRKAYYEASGYVHQKISENEQDNTGVEAAHKLEQAGEEAAANIKNSLPSGRTLAKKVQREMERRARKAEKEYHYSLFKKEMAEQKMSQGAKTFVADAGKESGIISKKQTSEFAKNSAKNASKEMAKETAKNQAKRNAKRMAKKAAKEAQKEAAKKGAKIAAAKAAEKTAEATAVSGTAAAGGTAVNVAGLATGVEEYVLIAVAVIVIIILLIVLAILTAFLIYTQIFFQNNVLGAMYQSEPMEIEAAELHYSYMEASLKEYMERIDEYEPDYDGYVVEDGDSIGHNPFTLINYLSAKYEDFTFNDVKDEVEDLFSTSYTLVKWVEDIEVTPEEPEEEDDEEEEEQEPIILHVLHIKLTKTSLEGIAQGRLNTEEKESYDLLGETLGGLQYIRSPIGGNYYGNISSLYGYRYHPIHKEIRLHRGIDIAIPEGTDLYAGIDGVVTVGSDPEGYGNYVIISGADGTEVRYAHMSNILVNTGDAVHAGDIFGQSGNTGASTGPHVHVEVKQNGEYYNPLFYLDNE